MDKEFSKELELVFNKLEEIQKESLKFLELDSHYFRRNKLPNDCAISQKIFMDNISSKYKNKTLTSAELLNYGFRTFSQNNEDGILLAIYSVIGIKNKRVVEIGANCSSSDVGIPESCSSNLIINHHWHGVIIDSDKLACEQQTYFFARNFATKHFHSSENDNNYYYSPVIVNKTITPENVSNILKESGVCKGADLIVVDIDGGDFEVVKRVLDFKPRVLVVEFEKRFKDTFSVYQKQRKDFSESFNQSGTVSILAWIKLMKENGYSLIAVNNTCFNAFFVLNTENDGKIEALDSRSIFDDSSLFSYVKDGFWLEPDSTWSTY